MILFIIIFFVITAIVLQHLFLWSPKNMTGFYKNKTPLFIAHRGYLINKPENTTSSFIEAVNKGAKALEIDVIKTKDNEIICSHNYDLGIETDLYGDVSTMDYSHIKKANTSFKQKHKKEPIPRLIDVLKQTPPEIILNIEIKTKKLNDISIARNVMTIIKKEKRVHRVLISSFNPLILWYVKWIDKNVRTGFLYDNPKLLFLKNIIHPDCIHPKDILITKNLVKHCHERGLCVNAWTTNNTPSIHWLMELGIDGVITDNPKFFIYK